jgi:hypothetical protein
MRRYKEGKSSRFQKAVRGIDATKRISIPEYLKKVFTGW